MPSMARQQDETPEIAKVHSRTSGDMVRSPGRARGIAKVHGRTPGRMMRPPGRARGIAKVHGPTSGRIVRPPSGTRDRQSPQPDLRAHGALTQRNAGIVKVHGWPSGRIVRSPSGTPGSSKSTTGPPQAQCASRTEPRVRTVEAILKQLLVILGPEPRVRTVEATCPYDASTALWTVNSPALPSESATSCL